MQILFFIYKYFDNFYIYFYSLLFIIVNFLYTNIILFTIYLIYFYYFLFIIIIIIIIIITVIIMFT
jgi:hypothetical protein